MSVTPPVYRRLYESIEAGESIDVHTHTLSEASAIYASLLGKEQPSSVTHSAGVHPWYIDTEFEEHLSLLIRLLKNPESGCLAVGETGLDRLASTEYDLQIKVFLNHVSIAKQFSSPIVIHSVKSTHQIMKEIVRNDTIPAWIFHWYSGSKEEMIQLLHYPVWFSYGKDIVLGHKKRIATLKATPLDRILFETDDWDGSIEEVYLSAARHLSIDLGMLKRQIADNVYKAFYLDRFHEGKDI
ncbi:MAG: TatD family hydrolase [Fibrobacterales bacterium]